MLEQDLLLNFSGDLAIENGDLQLTANKQTLEQRIKRALLTFKGEWFLNEEIGIPYFQDILGHKNSIATLKDIFINEIQKIEGVKELQDLKIKLDNQERGLEINFTILDDLNNILTMEVANG
jgi:hypothetical protein